MKREQFGKKSDLSSPPTIEMVGYVVTIVSDDSEVDFGDGNKLAHGLNRGRF